VASLTYEALVTEIAQYHPIYACDAAHLVEVPASRVKDLEAVSAMRRVAALG
jgi:hypothetical protein